MYELLFVKLTIYVYHPLKHSLSHVTPYSYLERYRFEGKQLPFFNLQICKLLSGELNTWPPIKRNFDTMLY